ncbi:DMP19 family protein, partial [Vicingaceae bacterium]|nr:DMP19 family protein [Vicingaceae bacterium]
MEKVSNRALISRLYSSANDQLEDAKFDIESWKEWYNIVQKLTIPEKMVYVIVKMNQAVTNGGFSELYETSLGVFTPEIIHVLSEIKAKASADIVSSSLTIVNPKGLLDDPYKSFVFKVKLTEEQRAQLYNCDIQYDQLQDQENLEDLLGNYLQGMVK